MRLLIVEDEMDIVDGICETIKDHQVKEIEIMLAGDAGNALSLIFSQEPDKRPDAIVLDIMLPYGSAFKELKAETDVGMNHTGIKILERLRNKEREDVTYFSHNPLFVAVITGRADPAIYQVIERNLDGWGRIYPKPFIEDEMLNDLFFVTNVHFEIDSDLMPKGYVLPSTRYGDQI